MHNTGGFSYEILTVIVFGKYIWLVYQCNKVVDYSDMSFVEWTLDEWPSGNDLLPSHDRLSEKKNVWMTHGLLMFHITAIWTKCKIDWMIKATCNMALSQITAIFKPIS